MTTPKGSLADVVRDFLRAQGSASARAYAGDIRDLQDWLELHGADGGLESVTASQLHRYLRHLQNEGRSASTIRRRMTTYRALDAFCRGQGYVWGVDLDEVNRAFRIAASIDPVGASSPLLVSSEDELVLAGIRSCFSRAGVAEIIPLSDVTASTSGSGIGECDCALIHLVPAGGADRFARIAAIAELTRRRIVREIVVVTNSRLDPVIRLRLAEAGATFVYPYRLLAVDPAQLARQIVDGTLDQRFRLKSQWAMRQDLGLRWDGLLEPFLDEVAVLPTELWLSDRAQSHLPVSRGQLRAIQLSARDVAGLPEPDFRKYAASTRRPPELPEWPRVRAFVRSLWGRAGSGV